MSMRWLAQAAAVMGLIAGTGPAYPEKDPRNTAQRSSGLSSGVRRPNRRFRTEEDSRQAMADAEAKRKRKAAKRLAERDRG